VSSVHTSPEVPFTNSSLASSPRPKLARDAPPAGTGFVPTGNCAPPLMLTLSNTARFVLELPPEHTAKPTCTFVPMLTVALLTSTQFTPFDEIDPANVFPLRANCTQYGAVNPADVVVELVPPVLVRRM